MAWKCQKCGFDANRDGVRTCDGCGDAKFGMLILTSELTGKRTRMTLDTVFGRGLLKTVVGDDATYATEPQFEIRKDHGRGCWTVRASAGSKNPTCLNGHPLGAGATPLESGAIISIGPEKAKLLISIEG